jgi:hypothetical protein
MAITQQIWLKFGKSLTKWIWDLFGHTFTKKINTIQRQTPFFSSQCMA